MLCHFDRYSSNIRIFNSAKNADNHYMVFMFGLNSGLLKLLKSRLGSYFISLLDIVGVDLSKVRNYNLFFNTTDLHLPTKFFERCVVYNTFDYKLSSRYSF